MQFSVILCFIRLYCVTLRDQLTDVKTKALQARASDHPRQPGHLSIPFKYLSIEGGFRNDRRRISNGRSMNGANFFLSAVLCIMYIRTLSGKTRIVNVLFSVVRVNIDCEYPPVFIV